MRQLLLLLLFLLLPFNHNGQTMRFFSFAKSTARTMQPLQYEDYRADSTNIILNMDDNTIIIGNEKYEIFDRPKKWVVRVRYRFVTWQCTNANYEKVMIRYFEFDNKRKFLFVLGEHHAFRTKVVKK